MSMNTEAAAPGSAPLQDAALYAAVVLMWGTTWYAISFQVTTVSPIVSLAYRFAIAAPVMFAVAAWRGHGLGFALREHVTFALLGLTLFCLNFIGIYYAAQSITSGLLAVIFSSAAILNTINAALWLKTPVLPRHVLGGLLGVVGIGLIFKPEFAAFEQGGAVLWGLGLALAGTWCFSMANIVSAHAQRRRVPVLPATAWGMFYGFVMLSLFAWVSGQSFSFDSSPAYIGSLVYLALIGSVAAASAYLLLLGRIGPAPAAYATVLFPVVALMISTLFENYQWSWWAAAGLVLVAAGNVIISNARASLSARS